MADRVRDAKDVDHGDGGYQYPLMQVLNDWNEQPDAGPAGPESGPKQVRYSTPGHRVVRFIVWRSNPPSSIVSFLIGQVQRWLVGLRRRGPGPLEAGRPALDQALDMRHTRQCRVVDM
jgi:hypothetical protein